MLHASRHDVDLAQLYAGHAVQVGLSASRRALQVVTWSRLCRQQLSAPLTLTYCA